MADITYERMYTGGFDDLPSVRTPPKAEAFNHMEDGILAATAQANLALQTSSTALPQYDTGAWS